MNPPNTFSFDKDSIAILRAALERLEAGFSSLPAANARPTGPDSDPDAILSVLSEVADRLHDNYPYFHPLYAGQMLKPPHPVARLAYALAMWINPNNHALDGGRASSRMEKEAVADLARMIGWSGQPDHAEQSDPAEHRAPADHPGPTGPRDPAGQRSHTEHLGHLTGGGTMANLEALWIASQLRPYARILASEQAHYTHQRLSQVLGLPFEAVAVDRRGRMDMDALRRRLDRGGIGTVVATIGTTGTGAVDPLPDILALRDRYDVRLHADAAYGGYFLLADNLTAETRATYDRLHDVDSIVIDPHKHGLQPYGCGCVLFRDAAVGRFYKHESPYTYFSSAELHLGEISLECSRPGAAAVGLWATQRLLPLSPGGAFAADLSRCRSAAGALHAKLNADPRFLTAFPPELDIVIWAVRAPSVTAASAAARRIFDEAAKLGLHLALADLPVAFFDLASAGMTCDNNRLTCLRSVLMKPEHLDWIERIWDILDRAAA